MKARTSRSTAGNRSAAAVASRPAAVTVDLQASPSPLPPGVRSIPIVDLQRLAGNAAVADALGGGPSRQTITLQRDDPKPSGDPKPSREKHREKPPEARALWRDVRTAPLDEVERELKAVNDELFSTSMDTQRGKDLFETRKMLKKEINRRKRVSSIDVVRADLDFLAERQERVVDAARFTYTLAKDHFLGPFEKDMASYVLRFQAAYDKVDTALKKAAQLEKIRDALIGVVIGTGVGLAAGAIFEGATGFSKVAGEVGGEILEWFLGQRVARINPAASPGDIPTSMQPAVQELARNKKLLDAWKGVALMQATTMDVVQIQKVIRAQNRLLDTDEGASTLADVERRTQALKAGDGAGRMIEQLLQIRADLRAFRIAAEYGLARSDLQLEQDIWIAWINTLGPSPGGERPYHEAMRDVEGELKAAGVFKRLGLEDSHDNLANAPGVANRDATALANLDRLAVVIKITPTRTEGFAAHIIRFRHDAYQGTPQRDPDPTGSEETIRARSATGRAFPPGAVVKVADVQAGEVQFAGTGWGTRPVSQVESETAMMIETNVKIGPPSPVHR